MISKRASKLRSKKQVRDAWNGQMTLTELADRLGVSRTYFMTWIKREMPRLHKRILQLRYDYAARSKKPPNYRGRCVNPAGYVRVTRNGKRVLEHRLVAENKVLHRKLKPEEVVHHINAYRRDNRPLNLAVLLGVDHNTINAKLVHLFFEQFPKEARLLAEAVLKDAGAVFIPRDGDE